jgi:hypothetical protein
LSDTDDLLAIADGLAELKRKFVESSQEMYLRTEDQSQFEATVAEAKAILASALGHANDFTFAIIKVTSADVGGFFGGPSFACVSDVESLIRAAVRQINRKAIASPSEIGTPIAPPYVDLGRIAQIETLSRNRWDFSKLARLCKELNAAARVGDCHYTTAMLVRAITDHVPPLFGTKTFSQVVANYGGSASFKKSMEHLDRSLRNIADGILHEQIRNKESLPSPQQVDFRQDLDRLLGEIVRIV